MIQIKTESVENIFVDRMNLDKDLSVKRFQEYLRIKTVHPEPDYESAVKFLVSYGRELDLETTCHEVCRNFTIVVMKFPGKNPSLPSILLNSHTDVVPVYPEKWTHDPWTADIAESGEIYGRGTQDMKCVGIQYLEAIRMLKSTNQQFERDIYITFVPDEEIGGVNGMGAFVNTPEFKALNVGFALDEGLANPENKYSVFYAERGVWWVRVKCEGSPGHGSRFIENTAVEKLQKVMDSFLSFRREQEQRLKKNTCMHLGDVTSVNLTMLSGGVQPNVVPQEFTATFDIRIPPTVDLAEFGNKVDGWCKNAGSTVTYEFLQKGMTQSITPTDDHNPWWVTLSSVLKQRNVEVVKEIFSAATDGRFLRDAGYPVIGFSPMRNTPVLLHDNDEFIHRAMFLEGIEVYSELIPALANLQF